MPHSNTKFLNLSFQFESKLITKVIILTVFPKYALPSQIDNIVKYRGKQKINMFDERQKRFFSTILLFTHNVCPNLTIPEL